MEDGIEDLTERVHTVEGKLDRLSTSVEQLSASMDQGFRDVDVAMLEQRQYTEFAWSQLNSRLDGVETRLDSRIDGVEARIDGVEAKMGTGFAQLTSHVARLERKLDQVIDRYLAPPPASQPHRRIVLS